MPRPEGTFSLGSIPDFSTFHVYAALLTISNDDPRLLALWCHFAFWQPVDEAMRERPTVETWLERIPWITPDAFASLSQTLIAHRMLNSSWQVLHGALRVMSWDMVLPFSNELRRRAGIKQLAPMQGVLFTEKPRDDA